MSKYKKPIGLLLCLCVVAIVISVFVRADSLPSIENTEELGHALGILTLLPPVFAVLLAFLTSDVIL